MPMKFSMVLPHGPMNELAGNRDPLEAYEALTNVARTADEAGFSTLWLSDVLWPSAGTGTAQNFLFECWSSLAALARDTKRVRLGQTVTYAGLRNPALLAKMASTVDVLSHGRLTVGIGSGSPALAEQYRAYGYEYPEQTIRSRQLREVLQILLAMWTQEEATFAGKYYQVHEAINQPKGVQRPHIPLLIGGNGEQATLKLVAQYGNACNVFGDPATLEHKFAVLKHHCETLERDYQSIQRTAGTYCVIADTDEQALASIPDAMRSTLGTWALIGSLATIRARIAAFENAGVQELSLRFYQAGRLDVIQHFAQEFIV